MELGNTGKKISYNSSKNELWYDFDGSWKQPTVNSESYERVYELYRTYRRNKDDVTLWTSLLNSCQDYLRSTGELIATTQEDFKSVLTKMINFFSEFDFSPSIRFTNTLIRLSKYSRGKEFVCNYFRLQDSVCSEDVAAKTNSPEFRGILEDLSSVSTSKRINTRLKIYYGPQGTGKTTRAMSESEECIVCHSAMLPSDLMEDFKFVDGKATFDPSPLWRAMEEGKKIVLDEINLLPFESLRFLQSILDGKSQFLYKGREVKIKEGFEVIGTMNLIVNGMKYPLPEPLVDRCEDIQEFEISPEILCNAI